MRRSLLWWTARLKSSICHRVDIVIPKQKATRNLSKDWDNFCESMRANTTKTCWGSSTRTMLFSLPFGASSLRIQQLYKLSIWVPWSSKSLDPMGCSMVARIVTRLRRLNSSSKRARKQKNVLIFVSSCINSNVYVYAHKWVRVSQL